MFSPLDSGLVFVSAVFIWFGVVFCVFCLGRYAHLERRMCISTTQDLLFFPLLRPISLQGSVLTVRSGKIVCKKYDTLASKNEADPWRKTKNDKQRADNSDDTQISPNARLAVVDCISKSKCTKHTGSIHFLEIVMSKKVDAVVARGTFEVKMHKTHQVRTTFGKLRCRKKWTPLWREAHFFGVKMLKARHGLSSLLIRFR